MMRIFLTTLSRPSHQQMLKSKADFFLYGGTGSVYSRFLERKKKQLPKNSCKDTYFHTINSILLFRVENQCWLTIFFCSRDTGFFRVSGYFRKIPGIRDFPLVLMNSKIRISFYQLI